jgi:hypothetical protein
VAFFHCRLIAPRPDFARTMSEAERALMGRHADYLRSLGPKAVVFGPVLDPAGPWGLGVFEVEDEAELRRLLDADPTIGSGAGFRYEILPMMAAVRVDAAVHNRDPGSKF